RRGRRARRGRGTGDASPPDVHPVRTVAQYTRGHPMPIVRATSAAPRLEVARAAWHSSGGMAVALTGIAHVGIRVHDLARSVRFYELLGFKKTAGPMGPEPVAILEHPSGIELNLVLNAAVADEPNVLMDTTEKHAGITHIALLCP